MRGWIAFVVVMLGCGSGDLHDAAATECVLDRDCMVAGARCCDCPTFAIPLSDPIREACAGVRCPDMHCPDNVRAACQEGRCALACVAMECPRSCLFGFATDGSGCLTCECAEPLATGCLQASDCARVRADCCGCARGGHDTAVLARDAAHHDDDLDCPATPQCPGRSTCDAAATVQCIRLHCVLSAAVRLPPSACGRIDLPPCEPPDACVINSGNPIANEQGVGVCLDGRP